MRITQDRILTVILVGLVLAAHATHDNPMVMIPLALAAIIYSGWVGWKAEFKA